MVLVSSGAIADGMQRLGWKKRPTPIHELQAAAAVGQMGLVQVYESCFRQAWPAYRANPADPRRPGRSQALPQCADHPDARCSSIGVIPIINENDTVVTDEIKFGDNDTLGALVANLIEADALIILTDQPGLYTADPRKDPSATLIREATAGDRKAGKHGRRRRHGDRQGWHDHQGARRQAGGQERRPHGDRHRPRNRPMLSAWPMAKRSAPC